MPISVHDNTILGYEVSCEGREICIRTEYRDKGAPFERTNINFSGVEAYEFVYDCMGNIIFRLEDVPSEDIVKENQAKFEEGFRLSGWPRFWKGSLDEALNFLKTRSIRGFRLSSSYGMSGWVLAAEMRLVMETKG